MAIGVIAGRRPISEAGESVDLMVTTVTYYVVVTHLSVMRRSMKKRCWEHETRATVRTGTKGKVA